MSQTIDLIRSLPMFATLTPAQVAAFAPRFRVDHFDQNRVIFLEGDPADRLWLVQSGQVKIVKYSADGQENLLEVIMPGEMFGGAGILFPTHPATAVAMFDVTVLSLDREEYCRIIRQYPDVALRIIGILGERLRAAMHMRALSTDRVDTRVAHILLKLAAKTGQATEQGIRINLPLARQDIADMAGTTIETAIRIMSRFRKEGLALTEPGGYIVVTDEARLRRLSAGAGE
jgi:CRP/FNR family transcriptional regulator